MTTRGFIVTRASDLVTEECCACGVLFAMPESLERNLREHPGRSFYCPNGHQQHYTGKTEAEKIQEKLDEERRRSASLLADRDQAAARADHEAARAAGFKGALTRTRKRVAGGACPCCKRSFVNLARHMAGQHPNYAVDVDLDPAETP